MRDKPLTIEELERLLRSFKEKYGEKYGLTALGYFGSYARGEAKADSDVDIVFDTTYPNLFRTVNMREELVKLLDTEVDMVRINGIQNQKLKKRIKENVRYV